MGINSRTMWQAKYFAQDIGAGVGKSFQGVMQSMSTRGGRSSSSF